MGKKDGYKWPAQSREEPGVQITKPKGSSALDLNLASLQVQEICPQGAGQGTAALAGGFGAS